MEFINLGTRNKGTFWEYVSALSFRDINLPLTDFDIKLFLGVGNGMSNKHCHEIGAINDNCKIIVKEINKGLYNDVFFKKLANIYLKSLKKLKKEVKIKNFYSVSNDELIKKIVKIINYIGTTHPPMLQALYTSHLDDYYYKEVKKVLKKSEKKDYKYLNYIIPLLLTPKKLTLIEKEYDELLLLQRKFQKEYNSISKDNFNNFIKKKNIAAEIKKITNTYGWFHMEYMRKPFSENEYKKLLWTELKQAKNINFNFLATSKKRKIIKEQNDFFNSHRNIKRLKIITNIFQEFAIILEQSKVVCVNGIYLSQPIFIEIARRLGIKLNDILYLVLPEIVELLKNNKKADKKLIQKRKKYRAVLLLNNEILIREGSAAQKIEKKYIAKEIAVKNNIKQIKGIVAYSGKCIGKAIIIRSIKDINKFKKGDVLITHDGSAELTIFLKNAGAIVTNEGGMICHAAIVAREMNKPCIVGTKIATKVFKDGDLVEVDADKGIVKILKKAK